MKLWCISIGLCKALSVVLQLNKADDGEHCPLSTRVLFRRARGSTAGGEGERGVCVCVCDEEGRSKREGGEGEGVGGRRGSGAVRVECCTCVIGFASFLIGLASCFIDIFNFVISCLALSP